MTVKAHSPEQKPLPGSSLASHGLTFTSHSICAAYFGSAIPHGEVKEVKEILETINKHRISKPRKRRTLATISFLF